MAVYACFSLFHMAPPQKAETTNHFFLHIIIQQRNKGFNDGLWARNGCKDTKLINLSPCICLTLNGHRGRNATAKLPLLAAIAKIDKFIMHICKLLLFSLAPPQKAETTKRDESNEALHYPFTDFQCISPSLIHIMQQRRNTGCNGKDKQNA